MTKISHKYKWLITISLILITVICIITYFYFTNRLGYLLKFDWSSLSESFSKIQKWILSGTLIAVIVLGLFINLFASFLYNKFASNTAKRNTEKILQKQNDLIEMSNNSNIKLDELIENSKLDLREIERYIKELPIKEGIKEVENKISAWYNEKKINQNEKEILFFIISEIFKQYEGLTEEINRLKIQGKNEIAKILESIQIYFRNGDASGIKNIYFKRKEKLKQENISILRQSIKSTEALFAHKETKDLYLELIGLDSSAESYFDFALFSQKYNFIQDAEKYYNESLKINRDLAKENPSTYMSDVALILNNLAILHWNKNEFSWALEEFNEALKIRRDLAKENPRTYMPDVALTLNNLASLHKTNKEFPQALEEYEEALEIYRDLAKENPRTYIPFVATTLNNMATLHLDKNEFPQALEEYEEALKIRRDFAKENARTYMPDVAMTLNNLANLHRIKNEYPQALEEYYEALKIRRDLAIKNPRTYMPFVATTLNNLATLHKNKYEFTQALEEYYEALKIRRDLAKENPRTYMPNVAMTLNNLATLHSDKNEFPQALEEYEEALKIRRDLAKENPRTYLPDVAMTLNNLATLHSHKNEFTQALEEYDETLKIFRDLAKENPRTYMPFVAITLNNLANLHRTKNEYPQALEEYEEGLKIYRDLAKENPETFGITYSQMLIMGIDHFGKEKEGLTEARRILMQYPNVYQAQKLLEIVNNM